jgi:hypothetical protein
VLCNSCSRSVCLPVLDMPPDRLVDEYMYVVQSQKRFHNDVTKLSERLAGHRSSFCAAPTQCRHVRAVPSAWCSQDGEASVAVEAVHSLCNLYAKRRTIIDFIAFVIVCMCVCSARSGASCVFALAL